MTEFISGDIREFGNVALQTQVKDRRVDFQTANRDKTGDF